MMTMMNYNSAYYPRLVEAMGFTKKVDFVSCYLSPDAFQLPERIHSIADRARSAAQACVSCAFKTKREMMPMGAKRIGIAYNKAFVNNWEYYPLTGARSNSSSTM